MANWCGGIRLDKNTLKIINGVICDANATTVDRSKAVSTCGQLWDGALFTVAKIGGAGYITLHGSEGEGIGVPIMGRGNCGVGLDGRFFKIVKGAVTLQEGFLLTVDVTPKDALITVTDADGTEVDPVSGNTKQFLLSGIGDTYTVTATKTGYTTEAKQVKNTGDQTFKIVMQATA
jgi:hypothetical protein